MLPTFKPRFFYLFLALGTLVLSSFIPRLWQEGSALEKLLAKLTAYTNNYPQEKVYLHLDKPYYAAGEDIWFSAYLVNAAQHTPSPLSKVLYVELINPQDSVYRRVVVDVENGFSHGDFALEDTIPAGQYKLRAYTSWMQNSQESYFFHQNLDIFNPRVDAIVPAANFTFTRKGNGDSVLVDLQLSNYKKENLGLLPFTFTTQMGKKTSGKQKGSTNLGGTAQLRFYLPDHESRHQAKLLLSVQQDGKQHQKVLRIPTASQKIALNFFPESGELVNGIWSRIGFKAIGPDGLGKDVEGAVFDEAGAKVADFKSLKLGMGRFGFMPVAGKTYQARLQDEKGLTTVYPLPAAKEKGVVVMVDNTKADKILARVVLNGYSAADRPKALNVVAHSRGRVCYSGYSGTEKDMLLLEMPRKSFPAGVIELALFSEKSEPLAERLFFVHETQALQVTLTPQKETYAPREKITMQLQAKDLAGKPVAGRFSVAVTDAQKVELNPYSGNIFTHLLLTSDLKGYIEKPGYYFLSQDSETQLALDNLMLTQGWRRFVWKDVLQEKVPNLAHALERGLAISGTVQKLSGKPEANAVVTLIGLGKSPLFTMTTADAQGKFVFSVKDLTDSAKYIVQARGPKGRSSLNVLLDKSVPLPQVTSRPPFYLPPALLSDKALAYLRGNQEQLRLDQLAGKSILLNTVEVRGRKDTGEDEEVDLRRGIHGTADRTFKGDDLPPGLDVINALTGRVAGMQVSNGEITMRGSQSPLFLLDGMPVDAEQIRMISMQEVESIDVLKPGPSSAIYGLQGGGGVIAVTLKRGASQGFTGNAKNEGLAAYTGLRYYKTREFYMPSYNKPQEVEMPDIRSTLYWNPSVTTNAQGLAQISFFAADPRTTYQAMVEGLSANGQLGKTLAEVQVK
ncbi:MAG: TonB-dependent receptor plug domain-containing protein [Rufibacter sp.]